MKKSHDPELALLEYRNTPLEGVGLSPVQMLMSRRTSSILPIAPSLLMPEAARDVSSELKTRQMTQKKYHDRHGTKPLQVIEEGEAARIREGKQWEPVMVRKRFDDRSYLVETHNGQTLRRNRQHLLRTGEKPFEIQQEVDVEEPEVPADPVPQTQPQSRRENKRQ